MEEFELQRRAEAEMSGLQKKMSEVRYERLTNPELARKKIVYIMRGVPGSGKSTVAREIAHPDGIIHSTDSKFYDEHGEYVFDPKRLKEYHDENFDDFCKSLDAGVPIAILDNTNVQSWHYERYVEAAEKAGYAVRIIEMLFPDPEEAAQRNEHNVSKETIERMIMAWEHSAK